MAELANREKIRDELVPVLKALIEDVLSGVGGSGCRLEAAVLFGSATGGNFIPGKSDINIFMVFDKVGIELLVSLRGIFNRHFKKLKSRPVVVDREFVEHSTDVFPMEFLEWRDHSVVIFGDDPLRDIDISLDNLRHQVEENLRGKRLRLIQSYFEMDTRRNRLQPFLEETLPNFLTVFRNILRLIGKTPVSDAVALIEAVQNEAGVELTTIRRLQQMKVDKVKMNKAELDILFRGYIEELKKLTEFVDAFVVNE